MTQLTEDSAAKFVGTLASLRAALQTAQVEWELDRQARVAVALAQLDELKTRLPVSLGGGGSAATWSALAADDATRLSSDLRAVRLELVGLLEGDGPTEPPYHPMRYAYASPLLIVVLFAAGLVGTSMTLKEIVCHWSAATGDTAGEPPTPASAVTRASSSSVASASAAPAPSTPPVGPAVGAAGAGSISSPIQGVSGAGGAPTAATGMAGSAIRAGAAGAALSSPSVVPALSASAVSAELGAAAKAMNAAVDELKGATRGKQRIPEREVLVMVILMGLLGGFLRLTSSMAKYVGNRALLRSWAPYYLLMPVVAASLAPMVYLLLRVGVLSGGTSGSEQATAHLNVFGLYAFAGLTGLFAEQAMGMLKDVFTRIFGGVEGRDTLRKNTK